ncbi:MAG: glycosyltransferase [Candidatus Coatesbacteria bacterium]
MKISGITIAYRAVENGYPLTESLRSLLPLCDEIVANVGRSDDGTLEAIAGLGVDRIRLLEEEWDLSLREKGLLLSRETNRALDAATGDWVVYLQADEVLHERDIEGLRDLMASCERRSSGCVRSHVDGIELGYFHFYGSTRFVQDNPFGWYTRAVRVVRRDPAIRSVGDALKFRRIEGGRSHRLRAVRSAARVYHYGWARPPEVMLKKQRHFDRFWHSDDEVARRYATIDARTIYADTANLVPFAGTHPAVMAERVAASTWAFDPGPRSRWPRWARIALLAVRHPLGKVLARWRGSKP